MFVAPKFHKSYYLSHTDSSTSFSISTIDTSFSAMFQSMFLFLFFVKNKYKDANSFWAIKNCSVKNSMFVFSLQAFDFENFFINIAIQDLYATRY